MAQRLVLRAKDGQIPLNEMTTFVETAKLYGVKVSTASYDIDSDGELRIMLTLPKNVKVVGKRVVRIKPKNKKERQIEEQIRNHKSKKVEDRPGYVPPAGKKGPPKQQKVKCPECNTRKPVVTIGGVRSIKPHISQGEPCKGSGSQVSGSGRKP